MATKNTKNAKSAKLDKSKKKQYNNPVETIWGKILIWVIVAAMALGGIGTIIYVIVNSLS